MLHSTSDILDFKVTGDELYITLCGDRDMPGEFILEGPAAGKISFAETGSRQLKICRKGERIAIKYSHEHGQEFVLKITLM